jgi:UDP-N-acetylmuramoyl-L-alanyl-D-glutamate--2,6-diaminopimelate ligase
MHLADLLSGLPVHGDPARGVPVTGLSYDTRTVQPGNVFVALKGTRQDSHDRLDEAIAKGASAVVVDEAWLRDHPAPAVPTAAVPDTRQALALLAARFHGHPSRDLTVIGVTGTNGKTTTTHLIEAILQGAGRTTGLIGTLGSRFAGGKVETGYTTPQAPELQALFAQMQRVGVEAAVMEVSSIALDQGRVAQTAFDVGVFTNLTVDHLDYHGTMEAYAAAKALLFEQLPATGTAVLNRDDPACDRFLVGPARKLTYSATGQPADLMAHDLYLHAGGSRWCLVTPEGSAEVVMRLPGSFNVSNALAAAGVGMALGLSPEAIARGLNQVGGVPGRVEVVTDPNHPFTVLVDYAHTPDGLENVLKTARAFTRNRLIVVFGCGGDRDATKRPEMGRIASTLADEVFLTSDNPRSEDPLAIMGAVQAGMTRDGVAIADRAAAIRAAIDRARPGDVVVIAGKGHETTQTIGTQVLPFDDRQVARSYLGATV